MQVVGAVGPSYGELAGLVGAQAEVIGRLEARVAEQDAQIAELRARLAQNSRNSSRPPSSDGYAKPPVTRSLRRSSGRKPGGQPGHRGHHLQRVERPDEVVWHAPERCAGCGGDLAAAPVVGEEARQVFDLPPVRLVVCEHRGQRRRCACGHVTTAAFPAGVGAPAQYGPRVRALGLYLTAYQHLPYDRAAQLLADWLGAPIVPGTLAAIVAQSAADLHGFVDVVREQLIAAPVCHFDETGARAEGRLRWLHSASTEQLTLYGLHDRRGTDGIDHAGVLPAFAGVAVHDGWGPYRRYERVTHALCNAHHLRELQGVIEQHPDGQSWAPRMDALLRDLRDTVQAAKATGAAAWTTSCWPASAPATSTSSPPATIRTHRPPGAPQGAGRSRAPRRPTCWAASTSTATTYCASPTTSPCRLTTTSPNATSAWSSCNRRSPAAGAPSPAPTASSGSAPTSQPHANKATTSSTPSPASPNTTPGCPPPPTPEPRPPQT